MQNPEGVILLITGRFRCWPEAQQRRGVGLPNANSDSRVVELGFSVLLKDGTNCTVKKEISSHFYTSFR
jgi:hypothetical protein